MQETLKSIILDLAYIALGYCLIFKVPSIIGLTQKATKITKIIGLLIIIFCIFNIINSIL